MFGSRRVVLLVEENPHHAVLLRLAFEKAGVAAHVRVVGDGEAAVAYLAGAAPYDDRREHPRPDLVLLDLGLPRRSGLEVLAWLREEPPFGPAERPPVVVLVSGDPDDAELALDRGAADVVPKPGSFGELVEVVRALGERWLAEPPSSGEKAAGE